MQTLYQAFPGVSTVVTDLAALTAQDIASLPNGFSVFVISEREPYRLDTLNPLTTSSPLIVARGANAGAGKWYRRSRAFVVANYTLWVQGFNSKNYVLGFTPGQLLASATVTADIILTSADNTNSSESAVVDGNGNLWWNIAGAGAAKGISKIALFDTLQTGAPTATVKIVAGTANNAVAFDKLNSMWIENGGVTLQKFSAPQYANSGSPTPIITVIPRIAVGPLNYVFFDDSNNLWASSFTGSMIVMLAASQLAASSNITQTPMIWSGANIVGPTGICIGPTGLLWAGSYVGGAGTVKAFSPVDPQSSNPAVVIALTSTSFIGVEDLAFDRAGNLWVLNFDNGHLIRIPAASLTASGAVVPDIDIIISTPTGALTSPNGMNFSYNPNRSGLLPSGGAPV